MSLQNKLKTYRMKLGINQQQLGKLAHTSRQEISQIERGITTPSLTLAFRLSKICNCKIEDLFEYQSDEAEKQSDSG